MKKKENIRKTFSDRLLVPFIFNVSGTGQKLPGDRENDRNFAGQRCQMYLYRRYKNTGQSHLCICIAIALVVDQLVTKSCAALF